MEKMLAGLSTRRYPLGLEPVGQQVEGRSATGKSAVAAQFVGATETAWPSCSPGICPSWTWSR